MILLVKLELAYLLGAFLPQPNSWEKAIEDKKFAAWQLYLHTLIYFVLVMLLVFDFTFWKYAAILAIALLVTDGVQAYIKKENARLPFFIVQAAQSLLILGVWCVYQGNPFPLQNLHYELILLWVTAVFSLTLPSSSAIKFFISKWSPQTGKEDEDSLEQAGKYIGILERIFVFTFVISGHWEAIGFLLAAKSIFRFGDLKETKDRKLTEYVLIGTLVSFGVAMFVGFVYNWLLPGL